MHLDFAGHPLHTRALSVTVRQRDADHSSATASLLDLRKRSFVPIGGNLQSPGIIHHMELDATVRITDRRVVTIETRQPTVAFEASAVTGGESCRDPIAATDALVGATVGAEWTDRVGDGLGGPRACYHVFTLAHLLGTTLEHALAREPAIGGFERPEGQRLFQRDIIIDVSQHADRALSLAVQLIDLHLTRAGGMTRAMDRFAEGLEFLGALRLDPATIRVATADLSERRRTAATLPTAPWRKRSDVADALAGVMMLRGATATLREHFPDPGEDAPLLDALLSLPPALIQAFAVVTDDWPAMAAKERWLVGMSGKPDSCCMWRTDCPLARARAPEDPTHGI
jgi:hypothetical protein